MRSAFAGRLAHRLTATGRRRRAIGALAIVDACILAGSVATSTPTWVPVLSAATITVIGAAQLRFWLLARRSTSK